MGIKEVLRKSVLRNTITSLTKARPTKYYRREKVKGKWRYYYTREQYQKEKGDQKKGQQAQSWIDKRMTDEFNKVPTGIIAMAKEDKAMFNQVVESVQRKTAFSKDVVEKKVKALISGEKVTPTSSVQQGKVSVSTKDEKKVTYNDIYAMINSIQSNPYKVKGGKVHFTFISDSRKNPNISNKINEYIGKLKEKSKELGVIPSFGSIRDVSFEEGKTKQKRVDVSIEK